jgi:hypothetical protein
MTLQEASIGEETIRNLQFAITVCDEGLRKKEERVTVI